MEKKWIFLIAVLIFILFTFLFLRLSGRYFKKEYGTKMWNHWTTRLYNWQAVIFYSVVLTIITMFLLKWTTVLTF
jgi:hypothetical protein